MAWRRARSLIVLEEEIQQVAPGTPVWDIGDVDHQQRASDHNPNQDDVVCAIDVLDDAGLDLAHLAETVRTSGHPAGKYVIYQDRIASWWDDWRWRSYGGKFHSHVHVSVGRGPDGQSTGPYDDTSPWGLEGDDMTRDEFVEYLEYALRRVHIDLTDGEGGRWWAGELMGRDRMSLHQALMWGLGVAVHKQAMPLLETLVANQSGLTQQQVQEAVAAGVRAAYDPEELADLVVARVDPNLDRAAVAAALREVLGSLDAPE